jgi:hypothetical protein
MTNNRNIAVDAIFTILYVGFTAAMICLSLALITILAFDWHFDTLEGAAAGVNFAGWMILPFAARIYRRITGARFSWRANEVLGGVA